MKRYLPWAALLLLGNLFACDHSRHNTPSYLIPDDIALLENPKQEQLINHAPSTPPEAATNTQGYAPITENSFQSPLQHPLSAFSIDVDEAAYANIRQFLNSEIMPPQGAVRIEEMINYFDYNYPAP